MATRQLTTRISVEVLDWVRERARQESRSVSGQVECLLKQAMAQGGQSSYQGARPRGINAVWDSSAERAK